MQSILTIKRVRETINWKNVAMVSFFHLLAIPVVFTFSWQNAAALLIGNWIVGSLGVGLGWHRLLTHRSFRAPKWLEYTLSILATMSMQDSPEKWIATHRMHHKFVDTDSDPHSARSGFWWPQIGWVVWGKAQDHDEPTLKRYIPDLLKDPIHVLISRFYLVPIVISAVVLFAIGGWTMVVWGVFGRVVLGWHTTWFVNSLSHLYGQRPHETGDLSTNNWFVAILTFGEGWHNNHHMAPNSARHGLEWYQFDMNWIAIRIFEKLGWATNIRVFEAPKAPVELKQAA
ncbi:MAG: fatty acid desaturase [Blastocatellia bacterium]|nr:fatty acid desaturase [Chloracidobacterium sp.]MBL8184009.1 fatty acid desaturase [Blastocatellia bacterium]HBE81748.1 acyl-CoA desaturase [Blastocatellia bacterium]HRJ89074.1 fatty acid desaturase [Pyrinomonadaceae bacterium]HRK49928.1 fatty acid desaturase [Pyrinomonadaceae bacterium]